MRKEKFPYKVWLELKELGLAGKRVYVPKHHPDALESIKEDKKNALFLKALRYLANDYDLTAKELRSVSGASRRASEEAVAKAKKRIAELRQKGLDPKSFYPF